MNIEYFSTDNILRVIVIIRKTFANLLVAEIYYFIISTKLVDMNIFTFLDTSIFKSKKLLILNIIKNNLPKE